jgi:hypothetical protein
MSTEGPDDTLEAFARALIKSVRDPAIRQCDELASGRTVGPQSARRKDISGNRTLRDEFAKLVPSIVDETLFQLLDAIDNGTIEIDFRSVKGETINLAEAGNGELGGWFMGRGGWRAIYSDERYSEDFEDLELNIKDVRN